MLARRRLALDLTALALGASACRPTAREVTRTASRPDAAALTSSVLGQLSYPTDVLPDGRVQLRGGDWEADSSSLDGASVHLATIAHGELSGDTHQDAVVILITNAGGTGRFVDCLSGPSCSDGFRQNRGSDGFAPGGRLDRADLSQEPAGPIVDWTREHTTSAPCAHPAGPPVEARDSPPIPRRTP